MGSGSYDGERFDRGCLQEFGRQESEADGSVLAVAEGEQNSDALYRTLLQPMGNRMEKNPLNLDAPREGCVQL